MDLSNGMPRAFTKATKSLYNHRTSEMAHSGKLLIDAGQQHGAAELGLQMFENTPAVVGALGTTPSFVVYAAANLVIRCSMTLDLCAASARWTAEDDPTHSGLHEFDLEKWNGKAGKQLFPRLAAPLRTWLHETRTDSTYADLKSCRDGYTHRHVRMDAIVRPAPVYIGSGNPIPAPTGSSEHTIHAPNGEKYPLNSCLPLFTQFAETRLEAFCLAIVASLGERSDGESP